MPLKQPSFQYLVLKALDQTAIGGNPAGHDVKQLVILLRHHWDFMSGGQHWVSKEAHQILRT